MMLSDVCLTFVVCLTSVAYTSGRRAACAAGRLDGAYWLIGPGPARPACLKAAAAHFRFRPGRGHIVAAARLQLVIIIIGVQPPLTAKIRNGGLHILQCARTPESLIRGLQLQLRFDLDSTAVRLLIKGHQGHSDVTL